MLPLQITPTPTALYFKDLDHKKIDEIKRIMKHDVFVDEMQFQYSEKNGFYVTGNEKELYKVLLYLTYDFDVDLL